MRAQLEGVVMRMDRAIASGRAGMETKSNGRSFDFAQDDIRL